MRSHNTCVYKRFLIFSCLIFWNVFLLMLRVLNLIICFWNVFFCFSLDKRKADDEVEEATITNKKHKIEKSKEKVSFHFSTYY